MVKKQYAYYEGEWTKMPNLDNLTAKKTGSMEKFDLSPKERDDNYAFRYTAILEIPIDGKYLFWQRGSDTCIVSIDNDVVFVNDGNAKGGFETISARPKSWEQLVYLKAGSHIIKADYMSRKKSRSFKLFVEGPDLYKIDSFQWLYFGWIYDHPKTWSLMGGTVVPGRKMRIQYAIESDGQLYTPDEFAPNRKEAIKWYLADNYIPSPVSEWNAGKVKIEIQHFANRVANDNATAVYSKVTIRNEDKEEKQVRLIINAGPKWEIPLTFDPTYHDDYYMHYDLTLRADKSSSLDFVALATGEATVEDLKSSGDFATNYKIMSNYYNTRMAGLAMPVTLPNQNLVYYYKSAQIIMWESVVRGVNGDIEMRTSGGSPTRIYNYDRTFSHDVPNMVDQFIREGDYELAKSIMESEYYRKLGEVLGNNFLDAIPKYIIPYVKYLQLSGDKAYFTPEKKENLKAVARSIHDFRDFEASEGHTGIMQQSGTLDNKSDFLIVDNFAALHGLAAYKYFCEYFGETDEAAWAEEEMNDLNDALNAALDHTMKRRGVGWYMAALDDNSYFWKNGYDGNWIGTCLMMSTFPWSASLQGSNLGGTWKETFDKSIDNALHLRNKSDYDIPERSWGAWWGHEYGAAYNAAMGMQLLFSDKHRTEVVENLEFLLDNQSAPLQWGESFDRGMNEKDWTRPAADLNTWAMGFDKQAIQEINIALMANGSVIIGRGVPVRWSRDGNIIEWKNVRVGNGKKLDYKLSFKKKVLILDLAGDQPDGEIIINLPVMKNNIANVTADEIKISNWDSTAGKVTVPAVSKKVKINLKNDY
jgi:hypothetical protein